MPTQSVEEKLCVAVLLCVCVCVYLQVTAKGKADEMLCWMFDAYLSLSRLLGQLCGANLAAVSRTSNRIVLF